MQSMSSLLKCLLRLEQQGQGEASSLLLPYLPTLKQEHFPNA